MLTCARVSEWDGFKLTDPEAHVSWLNAQIRATEQRLEALKDRRGLIRYEIAKQKRKAKH